MELQDLYNELDKIAELVKNDSDIPDNYRVETTTNTEKCLCFDCYKYFDDEEDEKWWGVMYYKDDEVKEITLLFLYQAPDFDRWIESQITLTR